jgi:hypothetical protein
MNKKPDKTLSYVEAAVEILRSEGRPLTSQEIIKLAVQRDLLHLKGKTPNSTLQAVLYVGYRNQNFPITRLAQPGHTKAKRGSVRWVLK